MGLDNLPLTRRCTLPPMMGPAIALIDVAKTVMPRIMIDAVNILMSVDERDLEHVAVMPPYKPQDNCLFIVNVTRLNQIEDVLCDHSGVWKEQRGALEYYFVKDASKKRFRFTTCVAYEGADGGVSFKRRVYKNKAKVDCSRVIIFSSDERCKYAMLQYLFHGPVQSFAVPPHGNSKKNHQSYARTFISTISSIKKTGKVPSCVFNSTARQPVDGIAVVMSTVGARRN